MKCFKLGQAVAALIPALLKDGATYLPQSGCAFYIGPDVTEEGWKTPDLGVNGVSVGRVDGWKYLKITMTSVRGTSGAFPQAAKS